MKVLLILALALFVGCSTSVNSSYHENGSVTIKNDMGSVTITEVEINGATYIVAVGNKKAAICPSAETLRLAFTSN